MIFAEVQFPSDFGQNVRSHIGHCVTRVDLVEELDVVAFQLCFAVQASSEKQSSIFQLTVKKGGECSCFQNERHL